MRRYLDDGSIPLAAEVFFLLVAVLIAVIRPGLGSGFFERLENAVERISFRRAIWLAFLVPIVFRIATMPVYPPTQPKIHDEFSYLLIADTLLEGRIANPVHPMREHFETMHVIQDPSYASKYPLLQGFVLALPQFFGLPAYVGVWIANGAMSAAIYWMLRSFLSPGWALLSVLVVFLRVGTFSAWMHSYWGGAASAVGGALAVGALMRLRAKPARKYAILMGLGIGILANSRPYEGAVLSAVLMVALLVWLVRECGLPWEAKWKQIVMPLGATLGLAFCIIGYHNYRVTGSVTKLPYMRNRELYGTPQTFYYQTPAPAVRSQFKEINDNYLWQFGMHQRGQRLDTLWAATREKFWDFWPFFLGPLASVPFLTVPWLLRRRDLRLALVAIGLVMLASAVYPFFYPHYLGPVAGLLLLVTVSGLLRIREWKPFGSGFGLAFSRWMLVAFLAGFTFNLTMDLTYRDTARQYRSPRTQVFEALKEMGGSHVVIVKYSPFHEFHWEIVYNAANIDASPVVWARDMGPVKNQELVNYYRGRKIWTFEPDVRPPRLQPYQALPDELLRQVR